MQKPAKIWQILREILQRDIILIEVSHRGDLFCQSPGHLWSNTAKFSSTYFRQRPELMCSEWLKTAGAFCFRLCTRLRWGQDAAKQTACQIQRQTSQDRHNVDLKGFRLAFPLVQVDMLSQTLHTWAFSCTSRYETTIFRGPLLEATVRKLDPSVSPWTK